MSDILIDSNIVLNVWEHEENPKTGIPPWKSSSIILEKVRTREVTGFLSITTIMELAHFAKARANAFGSDPGEAIELALSDINSIGFRQLSTDALTMAKALSLVIVNHLDPFDAILVAIAVNEGMDAIISRDEKLRKKTSKLIPVLTPEEFLSQNP